MDRSKLWVVVLVFVLVFLQYRLWFESGGIIDMLRIKKQLALQQQVNDKLKKRNEKLTEQVQYLQASNEAVEARARGELGMIKKNETFYQVVK
ncbi:MAG: cell division protein FtsB [Gammaproteobacteria bacterium]|nr:cell division protein FtsB [Gammaproteobacteria bacterium]